MYITISKENGIVLRHNTMTKYEDYDDTLLGDSIDSAGILTSTIEVEDTSIELLKDTFYPIIYKNNNFEKITDLNTIIELMGSLYTRWFPDNTLEENKSIIQNTYSK